MDAADQYLAPPGWVVNYLPETGSTNDLAKRAGEAGDPERAVFVADFQTHGRGRMGRTWVAPAGSCLLYSILFRGLPPLAATMACSVAACEAIEAVGGVPVAIKWPNDLMVKDRKLAGVLAENVVGGTNAFTVVGVGINVNFDTSAIPDIPDSATSLLVETGRWTPRETLLHEILLRLDALLLLDPVGREREARSRWTSRLWRRRQRIAVAEGSRVLEGILEGVAPDGALLLRRDDGSLETVLAGDVLV